MAEEKIHIIPLRKEWLKVPRWKRSRKSIRAVREYLIKHMKSEDVKLGKYLNEFIWERGMKKPLGKVKVRVSKDGEVVRAELFDAPVEKKEEVVKKKGLVEKITKKDKKENLLEKDSAKEKEEKEKKKPEMSKQEKELQKQTEKPKKEVKELDKEKSVKLEKENVITESGKK
jgi:large subunit ribosomal protein L31e